MELTWFGTAGFRIKTGGHTVLIDPYLSRNANAQPEQPLKPDDIKDGELIFISHGHFDHILDVPEIAAKTEAKIYCGKGIDDTLIDKGVNQELVRCVTSDDEKVEFDGFEARAFYSQHVKFDRWLMLKTLAKVHVRLPRYLPLMREYPEGQVLSWRFNLEDKIIHHFGSAGSSPEELNRLARHPTDILLVPLQGHTHIVEIALNYVKALKPGVVIPHHQDNFFPPISSMVNVRPFADGVKQMAPNTEVLVLEMNQSITF
jgi:L-ascorbate metabolism protein UlaG (beta-lactamase superfamily)